MVKKKILAYSIMPCRGWGVTVGIREKKKLRLRNFCSKIDDEKLRGYGLKCGTVEVHV